MGWGFLGVIFSLAIKYIELDAQKAWNQDLLAVPRFRKMDKAY